MTCSLDTVAGLVAGAIALLAAAIGLAIYWATVLPLLGAAAIVGTVSFVFIPAIKKAVTDYATCRGPTATCSLSPVINTLGQAGNVLSLIGFTAAAALQIAAIAFYASIILAWVGIPLSAAASGFTGAGIVGCGATILILAGMLTNAYSFKSCMDRQDEAARTK